MTSPEVSVAPAGVVSMESALRVIRSLFAWAGFIAVYLFLYTPLVTIGIFAFNDSTVQALPWSGFTLQWFGAIGQNGLLFSALTFGLSVSLLVVAVASVVGTYFAVVVNSATGAAPRVLLAAVIIPAIVPGMVLGLSLAITFRLVGVPPGLWSIVIGHLAFTVPVVTLVVLTRLRRLDPSLTQASMDLGANGWRTFWHVTFPQLRTAILAAALLTLTLSTLQVHVCVMLNEGEGRAGESAR